jgi:hypothetical protein
VDKTQLGRVGELALAIYVLVGTDGELQLYTPVADDDHTDDTVGQVREHPAFLYVVLLMDAVAIKTAWLVPSPDLNRLAYHQVKGGRETLAFRAYPDRTDAFAPFRVPPLELGPRLLQVIDSLTEPIPRHLLIGGEVLAVE